MNIIKNKIIRDNIVLEHFLRTKEIFGQSFDKSKFKYQPEMWKSIIESPSTTAWIKYEVFPKIHGGDMGLDLLLNDIEAVSKYNPFLSATRFHLIYDILNSMDITLNDLRDGVEDGSFSLEETQKLYDEGTSYKFLH